MTNSYKIIFDPDLWPAPTQNQPSQEAIWPQNYNSAQMLIPDQQIIQNNSPARYSPNKTKYIEENTQTTKNQNSYTQEGIYKQEIEQIVDEKISTLRIYVLESDITQAQNSIKSVVELASF